MNDCLHDKLLKNIINKAWRLDEYLYIVENLKRTNVALDEEYQKRYNSFYRVRRNADWRNIYFNYLEKNKYRKDLVITLPAKKHSAEVIKKLKNEGNEIYIITARRNNDEWFSNSLKKEVESMKIVVCMKQVPAGTKVDIDPETGAMKRLSGETRTNPYDLFALEAALQLREKVGVMFGNPETTTGGNALKFYASVRLDIRRSTQLKDGEEVIGNQTKVKVVKNKVAPPFRKAEFDIMFGEGISRAGEIIDLGADLGIIKKSGSWYSYNETKLGQGRDASKQVIQDNPELAEELEGLIFAALKEQE